MNPDPFATSNSKENPQKKKRALRKRILLAIVAILVVAALSVASYFVWKSYGNGETQTTAEQVSLTPEEQAAKEKFAEIDAKQQADARAQLDAASSAIERADAYLAMANAATTPDEKLSYALKAVDEDKNADTLMAAMNFADIAGDTAVFEKMQKEYSALGVKNDWEP